ncbi:MAG: hypothetical protein GY835_18165 [bacterium]|nr:hypothetical protein [bacterium]
MSVNVIGDWAMFWNFDGSGTYYQTTLTVNSDGSFSDGTSLYGARRFSTQVDTDG